LRSSIWPKVNASLRTLSDPGTKHCTIGTPVEVAFEDVNDEISQPKFRKAGAASQAAGEISRP
jgi:hypothetical protein